MDKVKGPLKPKTLFDHVKAIKQYKEYDYYNKLSEEDRKSYNRFMILRVLSMDKRIIDIVNTLHQYYDKIKDENVFCNLMMDKIPQDSRFHKYIKKQNKSINSDLIVAIKDYFKISYKDAQDYYDIFISNEDNFNQLIILLENSGLSEKEIDKLFKEKKY